MNHVTFVVQNVALAASHLGLSHRIDTLITLNKPTRFGEDYQPGNNIGNSYNISAYGDWTQWWGSDDKLLGEFSTDRNAHNMSFDTSSSNLKPHGVLIWDDNIRDMWWQWFLNQPRNLPKGLTSTCVVSASGSSECSQSW